MVRNTNGCYDDGAAAMPTNPTTTMPPIAIATADYAVARNRYHYRPYHCTIKSTHFKSYPNILSNPKSHSETNSFTQFETNSSCCR